MLVSSFIRYVEAKKIKMKIGILTIHFPYNYGAMLQAYALDKYLKNEGYNSQLIDYKPYYIDQSYHFRWESIFHNPRLFLSRVLKALLRKNINRTSFENFYNQMGACSVRNIDEFDVLIVGSDQVWNPKVTDYDTTYLLDKDLYKEVKKVSYASSIAIGTIDSRWEKELKKNLSDFDALSVREEENAMILSQILNRKVDVVCDPTFLLADSQWRKMAVKPSEAPSDEYILVYRLQDNSELDSFVENQKNRLNLPVVTIHPFGDVYRYTDYAMNEIGPAEFLWLIDHANVIVTNSFHGFAFSTIFKKRVAMFEHSQTGSRMRQILNTFNMSRDKNGFFDAGLIDSNIYEETILKSKKWLLLALSDNEEKHNC